jgi:O-antigen ligase
VLAQLLAPTTVLDLGLLALASLVTVLGLARVEGGHSRFPAGRVLVWLMVLASVLPTTIDELTQGRAAVDAGLADPALGSLAQNVSRAMQVALVIVAVLALREAVRSGASGTTAHYWLFFVLWFVTLLSAVNNVWSPKLLGGLMPLVAYALFAAARAGAPLIAELRRVMVAILVVSLTMYVLTPAVATLSATRSTGVDDARLAGVFSHPNGMGAAAAVALLLALVMERGVARSMTVVLAVAALLLSDSRTALVAVAACVPLLLAAPRLQSTRVSSQARRLGVVVGALSGGFLLVQGLLTNSSDVASVNGRTLVWDYVIEEWHSQRYFGAGPDGWTSARLLAAVPQYAGQAHNQFFETLYLFGLFGVIVLTLLLVVNIASACRLFRAGNPLPLGVLVCLLVTGFSESPLKFDISGLSAEGAIALVTLAVIQGSKVRPTRWTRAEMLPEPVIQELSRAAAL